MPLCPASRMRIRYEPSCESFHAVSAPATPEPITITSYSLCVSIVASSDRSGSGRTGLSGPVTMELGRKADGMGADERPHRSAFVEAAIDQRAGCVGEL